MEFPPHSMGHFPPFALQWQGCRVTKRMRKAGSEIPAKTPGAKLPPIPGARTGRPSAASTRWTTIRPARSRQRRARKPRWAGRPATQRTRVSYCRHPTAAVRVRGLGCGGGQAWGGRRLSARTSGLLRAVSSVHQRRSRRSGAGEPRLGSGGTAHARGHAHTCSQAIMRKRITAMRSTSKTSKSVCPTIHLRVD